jgi:hypothetical protein
LLHGSDEFEVERVLEKVARGSGFLHVLDIAGFGVHAEDQDLDPGLGGEDSACGEGTILWRQGVVEDDDVGSEAEGQFQGFVAVAGFTHNFDIGIVFEQAAEAAAYEGVVVNEEDAEFRHELAFRVEL